MKKLKFLSFVLLVSLSSLLKAESAPSNPFIALSQLTSDDFDWIGAKIYQNEASSNPKYLTHWGKGEDFPSFGIGHFIWFPKNISPPFKETFPAMLQFVSKSSTPPKWLQTWQHAPWQSKLEFDAAQSSKELNTLRQWLLETKAQQAHFIAQAFEQRWQLETATIHSERLKVLNDRLQHMMSFKQGLFAVVDYFNFKGLGNNLKEQYQGKSWGLISVLEGMPQAVFNDFTPQKGLVAFIDSAKNQLQQRTELAPVERKESRWIPGWFARLEGYAQ